MASEGAALIGLPIASTSTWRFIAEAEQKLLEFFEAYYNAPDCILTAAYRTPNETEADDRLVAAAA